jgi:hypothetical protein
MSYLAVLQGTPTWMPVEALDVITEAPRTGITFGLVSVFYKKSTQSTFQLKVIITTDFKENGSGIYEIQFSAAELNTEGTFLYIVNGNLSLPAPAIKQYFGQAVVQVAAAYTPGTISLNTNFLTGNLVDIAGNALIDIAVSARVLEAPEILGVSPNVGGVGTDLIGTRTDSSGFFALEVLQNSLIDITIPRIGYRRTLRVPANVTDKLFELP